MFRLGWFELTTWGHQPRPSNEVSCRCGESGSAPSVSTLSLQRPRLWRTLASTKPNSGVSGPGLSSASASASGDQMSPQCHTHPGVWPGDSWHHPSWHGGQPSVTSVTRHRPGCDVWRGYVMWRHVTCDDDEWLSAYVNQRETSPSHCLKMSHYNGSKVYNIPLFQSLEPHNDILEEFLPSADIDTHTGRTPISSFQILQTKTNILFSFAMTKGKIKRILSISACKV